MKYLFISLLIAFFASDSLFSQSNNIKKINGKYGLINAQDTIIPPDYDKILPLYGCDYSYYAVQKNGKFALWNYGRNELDFKYDYIYTAEEYFGKKYKDAQIAIPVINNKIGILSIKDCSYSDVNIIEPKYNEFYINTSFSYQMLVKAELNGSKSDYYLFDEGFGSFIGEIDFLKGSGNVETVTMEGYETLIIYEKNKKHGISTLDRVVLEPQFDKIEYIDLEEEGIYIQLFKLHKNNKVNFYSYSEGFIVLPEFMDVAEVLTVDDIILYKIKKGNKYVVFGPHTSDMDTIPPINTNFLSNLYFDDVVLTKSAEVFVEIDEKWALVENYGYAFLTDFVFKKPVNSKFRIKRAKNKFEEKSKKLKSNQQPEIEIYKENGKYGLRDDYYILPAIFDTVFRKNMVYIVKQNNYYGIYNRYELSMLNIDKIEYNFNNDSNLLKLYNKDRYKIFNSNNPALNSVFYDESEQLNDSVFIGKYNYKYGAYTLTHYDEILPSFDSVVFPDNQYKYALLYNDSLFNIAFNFDYNQYSDYYSEFQFDKSLNNLIYAAKDDNWKVYLNSPIAIKSEFSSPEQIHNLYVKPFLKWKNDKISKGFKFSKIDSDVFEFRKNKQTEIYYYSIKDFINESEEYKYLIYSGEADSVKYNLSLSNIDYLVYNNGLMKPIISNSSDFNNRSNFFKSYEIFSSQYPVFISEDNKKYIYFYQRLIEFEEISISENQNFITLKNDNKVAVYIPANSYFSDFIYEDIYVEAFYDNAYAFKQNGKWGVIAKKLYPVPTGFKIVIEPKYKSAKKAIKAYK